MSEYVDTKRRELFEKIARERLGRAGGKTRIGADGKTELAPTFNERMVLTGWGNIDASDEMAEINKIMKGMKDTQNTETYIEQNVDKYPELKGYDVSKGKAGALEIVETEQRRDKVKEAAALAGYSGESLGIDLDTVSLEGYGNAVRKAEEKRKADLLKPGQDLAKGQLELSKTQAEKADAFRTSQLEFQKSQAEESNAFRRHQLEVEGIRAENARRERQFEAAQNRELTREQNKMQLNIAMMDRQDKREDRRIAREDREADKRQASIMMLIKGLTQLGAGFSI